MDTKKVKIKFCGGTSGVTGSNFLLEDIVPNQPPLRVLVDCGLFQGSKAIEDENFKPFPYDPATIDAVFITHAHMDHIGRLPRLVKEGFRGTIYSTPPTKDISAVAFDDALGLMEKGQDNEEEQTLYGPEDIQDALKLWRTVEYHEPVRLGDFDVVLRDSGHILGSSMIEFTYGRQKIVFTGDLGNSPTPLLRDTEKVTDATYLIMESVYGDRNHEGKKERREKLEDAIEKTMKRGGALLIPAFSIERTQELLFEIENMMENSKIPLVPVFLDSPMAIKVTDIYKKYENYLNENARKIIRDGDGIFRFPQFHITMSTEESKAIDQSNPRKIIMAGSGMSNGGRILHHEKKYLPDPRTMLLLVGYQSVGSLGRLIQDGERTIKIFGEELAVNAEVVSISGYSAHKDADGLLNFVHATDDTLKKVFVTMGEVRSSLHLVQRIRDYLGVPAVAPQVDEEVELVLENK